MITVGSPNGLLEVPALWLRDNCPCQECRVTATTEHRFVIANADSALAPVSVSVTGAETVVDWGDHQSHYGEQWWVAIDAQTRRQAPDNKPWLAEGIPMRFEYEAITGGDPEVEAAFLAAFCDYGAVIVTSTPTEPGSCEPFLRRWAPPIEVPFALIHDVYVDPAGYNVAHTSEALPPHTDMASKLYPPSGQILHMLVNEAEDGDSVLVDGFAVLAQLDEEDLQILESVPVEFRQFSATAETWCRAPVVRRNPDSSFAQIRFSNQLLQTIDPTLPVTATWYEAYHRLTSLIMDEANQTQFRLNSGDLMMINNHRVLHARRSFQPSTGHRHLQDIYFDATDVHNEAWRKANQL